MEYMFRCPKCGNEQKIAIPMDEYDEKKNKQTCKKCGNLLERVIEFSGSIGGTGGYDSVAGKASWQS